MIRSLFLKECKLWFKNVLFYAYIIIIFSFYVTQMKEETVLVKPEPGQESYGMTYSTDETVIMNETLKVLRNEYIEGKYVTYPFGFYKEITLSKGDTKQVEECITELIGKPVLEWIQGRDGVILAEGISYDEFLTIMDRVCDILGPGSKYSDTFIGNNAQVKMTYEQALQEYESILKDDKVTGAYARLFSDYIGTLLAVLPAFFGVTRVIKDKRSKVSSVLYAKQGSSLAIVLSRYLGMITMLFLPVLILSCFSLSQSLYIADAASVAPDYLAYVKYCLGWLLPEILFVTAISYLISEVTESILSIFVNGVIWFVAMFSGLGGGLKSVGWNLIPRFNTVGEYDHFEALFPQLIKNRLFYTGISLLLVGFIILVYKLKRKGGYQLRGTIFKHSQSES